MIPTMTLAELCDRMQALGLKTSKDTLADEIEAGMYPFADSIRLGDSKRRVIHIYTVLFEKWAAERMAEV